MTLRTALHCIGHAGAVVLGLTLLVPATLARAQPVVIPPTWGGDIWDRPRLTGDWFGLRDEMGKKGVVVDIDLLQVTQGVASGGRENVAEYGGLAEYTLHVDSQKLGLWPGGFLEVQGMTNYGNNVNQPSGALVPPDFLPLPVGEDTSGLMSLTATQFLSPKFGVFAGKLSALSADDNTFADDYHSQFLNFGLNLNMALDLFPFTGYGGGVVALPWDGAVFTASVLDAQGAARSNSIGESFPNGAIVVSEGRVSVKPFGLVGHQLLGFGWSSAERLSLVQNPSNISRLLLTDKFPRLANPGPILEAMLKQFFPRLLVPTRPPNTDNSTWVVYYNFDQFLWSPEGHADRGIGVFFRFGAADAVTSPVQYAYNAGVGGKGVVPGRPADDFGIGWSGISLSDNFVPFLRQHLGLGLRREETVDLYYNALLTPWLGVALDLQITDPALKKTLTASNQLVDVSTIVVPGLRVYARF